MDIHSNINFNIFSGWQLALVITAAMPCLAVSVVIMTVVVMKSVKATQECYSTAAAESE